jgi:outer membrane protein assembly factor BamB
VPRRRRRGPPWFPFAIALLTVAGVLWVRSLPEFERNLKGWLSTGLPLLGLALIVLWFLLSGRFSGRLRLGVLGGLVVLGLAAKAALRVDGTTDGRGLPRLVWRWQSPQTAAAALELKTDPPSSVAEIPVPAGAADVPQFFGAKRDGTVPDPGLARDWTAQPPRQLWRQPIGAGWSAFAVWGGCAYTQEQRGEQELVTCYELATGRLLWAHADAARFTQWQGGEGPRATPTLHQGRVYAYGATGLLNCLDAATGRPVWQRAVLKEQRLENIEWGVSASPLIVGDQVVVTGGQPRGPVLFAYRLADGAPVWQAGDDAATYASPLLATLAGRTVILANHARALTAHDPATGAVLLEHAWGVEKWPKASQPVVLPGDRVFVSAGYGMGCQMLRVTAGSGGALSAEVLWSGMKMKTQFNSPALHEGHLYGLDDGRLACVVAETGDRLWKEGRFASGQTLLAGGLVLVQSEPGPVHLCAADPTGFRELGRLEALSSKTWNHPVLAGRYLLLRNDREAACYELPMAVPGR